MAKVVAWLVLIFVVLLALRMINVRKTRSKTRGATRAPAGETIAQPMVRCASTCSRIRRYRPSSRRPYR